MGLDAVLTSLVGSCQDACGEHCLGAWVPALSPCPLGELGSVLVICLAPKCSGELGSVLVFCLTPKSASVVKKCECDVCLFVSA